MSKYVSVDIETTGLDPNKNQIIEFAAVIEDTENIKPIEELPYFSKLVLHKEYTWNSIAARMNQDIWKEIQEIEEEQGKIFTMNRRSGDKWIIPDVLFIEFSYFLNAHLGQKQQIVAAGKNFGAFDLQFLKKLPDSEVVFHHRFIDPAMLFMDFKKDLVPPSLSECLKRAGLDNTVRHRAKGDALQVIQLLRTKYDS